MRHLALSLFLWAGASIAPIHTLASEPPVDEVRRAALRHAGLDSGVDRWSRRARLRNLVPEITATAGRTAQWDRNVQFDERLTLDGDDELLFDSARNQDEDNHRRRLDFTIRATFDLRGLVFDGSELPAHREARARIGLRQEIADAVHEAYFGRLATLDALRAATRAEDVRLLHRRLQRQEAELDGLTGGWYAAQARGAQ